MNDVRKLDLGQDEESPVDAELAKKAVHAIHQLEKKNSIKVWSDFVFEFAMDDPEAFVALFKKITSDPLYDPEIRDHLRKNEKIQAIKRYRTLTGLSIKEAKAVIDSMADDD